MINDLRAVSPWLLIIFGELCAYAHTYGLPVVITSIIDDKPYLDGVQDATGRKTGTHREGRALDISINMWPQLHIERVVYQLNKKYGDEWGTGPTPESAKKVAVYHDAGSGYHIHLQCKRGIFGKYD